MSNFTAKLWRPRVIQMYREPAWMFRPADAQFIDTMYALFDLAGDSTELSVKEINYINSLWLKYNGT